VRLGAGLGIGCISFGGMAGLGFKRDNNITGVGCACVGTSLLMCAVLVTRFALVWFGMERDAAGSMNWGYAVAVQNRVLGQNPLCLGRGLGRSR